MTDEPYTDDDRLDARLRTGLDRARRRGPRAASAARAGASVRLDAVARCCSSAAVS